MVGKLIVNSFTTNRCIIKKQKLFCLSKAMDFRSTGSFEAFFGVSCLLGFVSLLHVMFGGFVKLFFIGGELYLLSFSLFSKRKENENRY